MRDVDAVRAGVGVRSAPGSSTGALMAKPDAKRMGPDSLCGELVAVHGAAILLGDGMLPREDREAIITATIDMVGDGLLRAQPDA